MLVKYVRQDGTELGPRKQAAAVLIQRAISHSGGGGVESVFLHKIGQHPTIELYNFCTIIVRQNFTL